MTPAERVQQIRDEQAATGSTSWDDSQWLLAALQATAEAFSACSNYSLGTDWRNYVVDGEPATPRGAA